MQRMSMKIHTNKLLSGRLKMSLNEPTLHTLCGPPMMHDDHDLVNVTWDGFDNLAFEYNKNYNPAHRK